MQEILIEYFREKFSHILQKNFCHLRHWNAVCMMCLLFKNFQKRFAWRNCVVQRRKFTTMGGMTLSQVFHAPRTEKFYFGILLRGRVYIVTILASFEQRVR